MAKSRYFKCYGCNHEWDLPYGTGQSGQQLKCPKCGGNNIHRTGAGGAGHGRGPSPEGKG